MVGVLVCGDWRGGGVELCRGRVWVGVGMELGSGGIGGLWT